MFVCFVISKINELECVPFFGTLLGLSRSKTLIKNDDDIDFIINREDVVNLLNIFRNTHLKLDHKQSSFISYTNPNYTAINSIDFYIYDNRNNISHLTNDLENPYWISTDYTINKIKLEKMIKDKIITKTNKKLEYDINNFNFEIDRESNYHELRFI